MEQVSNFRDRIGSIGKVFLGFANYMFLYQLAGRFTRNFLADAIKVYGRNSQIVCKLRYTLAGSCLPDLLLEFSKVL